MGYEQNYYPVVIRPGHFRDPEKQRGVWFVYIPQKRGIVFAVKDMKNHTRFPLFRPTDNEPESAGWYMPADALAWDIEIPAYVWGLQWRP